MDIPRVVLGSNGKTNRLQKFLNTFRASQDDRFLALIKRRDELVKNIKKQ